MKKILIHSLIFSFLLQPFAYAENGKDKPYIPGINSSESNEARAAEFVMRRFPGERLIPVRILGGVNRPGTYYFPEGMDIISAIALSGGLASNADPDGLQWTQFSAQKDKELSLEDLMAKPKELNPTLGANDILYVKSEKTWFSANFLATLAVVSSLLGIALATKVLKN